MKVLIALFAAAGLFLLAGCSTTRGVQRTVRLNANQRPTEAAIMAAIAATPGVTVLKQQHLPPTNGYGIVEFRNKAVDRFVYVSDLRHADGVIEISGNDRVGLQLKMYCLFQNSRPSAQQIAATRKLMDDLYASLRRQIPSLPPPDKVTEDLMDVPVAAH
jgi:predicted small secreted protein